MKLCFSASAIVSNRRVPLVSGSRSIRPPDKHAHKPNTVAGNGRHIDAYKANKIGKTVKGRRASVIERLFDAMSQPVNNAVAIQTRVGVRAV